MLQYATTGATPIFNCPASDFFALDEFRSYVSCHLHTDNKALSSLSKCALAANRTAGWVMQIHDYNLHIQYISGAENLLADTVSLNPAGLCEIDTKELFKPKEIVVPTVSIVTDISVQKSHRELSTCQARVKIIE
jgi:hypothetical protein